MRDRLIILGIVVVGALVSLLRVPAPHLDTVWAEDGEIFLFEALEQGPWTVLVTGYAGYQHLVPRLLAAGILSTLPLEAYGLAVFVACSIVVGLVAAAVFSLSRDLVPWLPARLGLAAITVLLPLSAQEVLGNLADLHSYGLWLAPWLALYRPRSWPSAAAWGVVGLLVAMTEIQAILVLPLLLLNVRHPKSWPIAAGLVLGAVAQVATTLLAPRPSTAAWLGIPSLVHGYLYNTVAPMVSPDPYWLADVFASTGILLPALAIVPFLVATVVAVVWGTGRQRLLVLVLAAGSVAVYCAGAIADGSIVFAYTQLPPGEGFPGIVNSRYGVASGMLLAATIPVAAAVLAARGRRAIAWAAIGVLVAWFAVACLFSESARSTGVTWSGGVDAARLECAADPALAEVRIPIAPARTVRVDCAYLD